MLTRPDSFSSRFAKRAGVVALLALPLMLLFGPALTGRVALWGWDWNNLFHPYVNAFARRWSAGHLALWTPEIGLGYPLFAEGQSLQLYPPMNLLLLFLPSWWACGVLVTLHYGIAALGTYAFCRRQKLPRTAAVLGALTFSLSAALTWRSIHPTVIVTVSLIPVFLCALDAALVSRRLFHIALAGGVLALQLLGGHHQFTFYGLLLALGYAVCFRLSPSSGRGRTWEAPRSIAIICGVIALAVSVCALPLAATFEMRALLLRQVLPTASFVRSFPLPLENLLLFFLPHLLGSVDNYEGRSIFWEACGYVTLLPFLAAIAALAARPRERALWFWIGVVLVSLALAIVDGNPLYRVLPQMPVFNWFRAPTRYIVLTDFALAMLFAHGFAILTNLRAPNPIDGVPTNEASRGRARKALSGMVLLGCLLTIIANLTFCGGQSVLWSHGEAIPRAVKNQADAIFNSLAGWDGVFLMAHLLIGGAILWLLLRPHGKMRSLSAAGVLAFLLCADLLRVANTMKARIEPTYFAFEPPTASFLKQQSGVFRVWTGDCSIEAARANPALRDLPAPFVEKSFLRPDQNVLSGVAQADSVVGLELLRPFNLTRSLALTPAGAFLSATDEKTKTRLILRGADDNLRERLMNLLNVRYLVSTAPPPSPAWREVYSNGVRICENRDVLPRAFLVGAARVETGRDALQTVLSPDFDPSREAVLEREDADLPTLPKQPSTSFSGQATLLHYEDTQIVLQTQSNAPGLLVISDSWYPGWRAWVDGREAPLLKADYTLRGISIGAGRHRVECAYRPLWWPVARAVSLASMLLLALGLAVPLLRRRTTPAQ